MKNRLSCFKRQSLDFLWMRKTALSLLFITPLGFADCRPMSDIQEALTQIEAKSAHCLSDLNPQSSPLSATHEPQLLVFLSFSMPPQSLRLWLTQAAKVEVPCLLRGFVENSLEKTHGEMIKVFEQNKETQEKIAPLHVHPEAFEIFGIEQVPAVVITESKPCMVEPCEKPSFDVIYGNTSLEDALTTMVSQGSREVQSQARLFLQRYRAKHE